MSLLINGMDMPEHAAMNGTDDTMYRSCVLVHPNGTAELVVDLEFTDQFNFDHNLKRFSLTEISAPHGDLIDRNELLNQYKPNPIEEQLMKSENPIAYKMMDKIVDKVTESINSVKAIIEAEE